MEESRFPCNRRSNNFYYDYERLNFVMRASGLNALAFAREIGCDFNRLMELFNFLGIPHYETLDRMGNVVRSGLRYASEEQFRLHLENLKQQLERR